nr:glycerate kinase [Rhodoferax sp.]
MPILLSRNRPLLTRSLALLALLALGFLGYSTYGWAGLALAGGALVMWALLHMSRVLVVLRRTAQNPVGSVASAVMLHARLERGMPLLKVLALTRALGQALSGPDAELIQYQWTDASQAMVRCNFTHGKLVDWELLRP